MNSVFVFNKYKKYIFLHFWLMASAPKKCRGTFTYTGKNFAPHQVRYGIN